MRAELEQAHREAMDDLKH